MNHDRQINPHKYSSTSNIENSHKTLITNRFTSIMGTQTDHVRLCIFFGPKIPLIHRRGIYLLLAIVSLQRLVYFNGRSILFHLLPQAMHCFTNEYSLSLLTQVPFLFSIFVGLFSDMFSVRRVRLVEISLVIVLFSSLFLVGGSLLFYLEFDHNGGYMKMEKFNDSSRISIRIFLVISYALFLISSSIFFPMSIVYGLDLLYETSQISSILLFPLFYFAFNIGALASYLNFVKFEAETFLFHSIVVCVISFLACFLFRCGRYLQWFHDSILIPTDYSFRKSIGIICQSLSRLCRAPKDRKRKSFLYLACRENGGSYDVKMIRMVDSMIWLNLNLFLLLPVFGLFQVLNVLFPQQARILTFIGHQPLNHNVSNHCPVDHNEHTYINTVGFFDPFTIIFFLPLIEMILFDITFGYKRDVLPWFIKLIPSKLKCLRVLRSLIIQSRDSLHNYLFYIDTTMKRYFWGLIIAFACVVAGLTVEVLQMNLGSYTIHCPPIGAYRISELTQYAQIPQYFLYGLFECITIVGLQQFVYSQCSNFFKSSMKGFFFGLYYGYQGLGTFLSSGVYYLLGRLCRSKLGCSFCLIHHYHCKEENLQYTWVLWVIALIGLSVVMLLYSFIVHYRHYKYQRAGRKFERDLYENAATLAQPLLGNPPV